MSGCYNNLILFAAGAVGVAAVITALSMGTGAQAAIVELVGLGSAAYGQFMICHSGGQANLRLCLGL